VNDQHVSQPEPSDKTLVSRVVQRDVTAFALLYDRYGQPVYSMAAHILGRADAEEIVQEVFLRLWNRADQFDASRGSFKAWFMTIARYRIIDELRTRHQRDGRLVAAEDINQLLANTPDPTVDVEKEVWLNQDSQSVRQALQLLPNEQRRALVLAYFGGFSQSTIARHLGWPLGTVKKRIRLGMQKLRAALIKEPLAIELQDSSTSTDKA